MGEGEPHRRHAAERQAHEGRLADVVVVEQRDDVADEIGEGVVAGGDGRRAVPARVVAQHAEMRLEQGKLGLPHRHGRAE